MPIPPAPGLEFLGREPPSGARVNRPVPVIANLGIPGHAAGGLPSGERSKHFAEYGKGRVPGSPSVDELRNKADLANAPSRVPVGGTRRVLFGSGSVPDGAKPGYDLVGQAEKGPTGP